MRFLADESVDQPIVERLRREGHDVAAVSEFEPSLSDDAVLDAARARSAVLLTADKDFGELVHRQSRLATGVVLIRLAGLSATAKEAAVVKAVREHQSELARSFAVISPGMVRIRGQTT